MTDNPILPCIHTECEKEVPLSELIFCEVCGCPQCQDHDVCEFCDTYVPTCEGCGEEFGDDYEFQMPYCSAHWGECDERYLCKKCIENWKCPRGGQHEMEFETEGMF